MIIFISISIFMIYHSKFKIQHSKFNNLESKIFFSKSKKKKKTQNVEFYMSGTKFIFEVYACASFLLEC